MSEIVQYDPHNKEHFEEMKVKLLEIKDRAENDAEFRSKLLSNTREAMKDSGLIYHAGMEFVFVEQTEEKYHIVLMPLKS